MFFWGSEMNHSPFGLFREHRCPLSGLLQHFWIFASYPELYSPAQLKARMTQNLLRQFLTKPYTYDEIINVLFIQCFFRFVIVSTVVFRGRPLPPLTLG